MSTAQITIPQYFNTEYPCHLFQDANGPCENFDITGCSDSCFNSSDGSVKSSGIININKDSDPSVDINEINYGNRLQTYYKYVTTKLLPDTVTVGSNITNFEIRPLDGFRPESLLTQTPVYLQKTHMIKETMLFIFLDQGHDFHVADERGNTMWTGVKKASATMVYRSPRGHTIVEDEDEIPAGKSKIDDDQESHSYAEPPEPRVEVPETGEYIQNDIDKSIEVVSELLNGNLISSDSSSQIEILYPYKNEYRNFAINTSFSGDIGVFGVMYMNQRTYDYLLSLYPNSNRSDINIDKILNQMKITYYIDLNSPYGSIIQIKNGGDTGIVFPFIDESADENDNKRYVIFLPFVGGSIYNNGMHSIWDFNEPRRVYIITLNKLIIKNSGSGYITTAEYGGKLFFDLNLIIPSQEVNLNDIIGGLTNANVYSEEQKAQKDERYNRFETILSGRTSQPPVRGIKYQISNLPDRALVQEFVFNELIKPFYSKYTPYIHPGFRSILIPNETAMDMLNENVKSKYPNENGFDKSIKQPPSSSNIEGLFYKQIGFVNDTAVVPSDNNYCKVFNSTNDTDYPYKFSVVSGPVDGSGQGGQITPEYHPPEIDVYMVVFNPQKIDSTTNEIVGGELRGIIARLTFTKQIYSNTLNSKNNSLVELHYVYIDFDFLLESDRRDIDLLDVNNYPIIIERLLNFALINTIINRDDRPSLKLILSTGEERLWFTYFIETVGPSVASLNSKIIQLTKTLKFINDIKHDIEEEKIVDFLVKMENKDNTNKLLSFVLGDEIPIIDTILRVAQNLYNTTPELWEYFEPDIVAYPIDEKLYTRNLTFERVFIIRNKYIGDKSRSTDCLFMNKSKYLECMQLSNDTNTLYTAQMYGLSTLWSTGGKKPIIYMAPYLNSHNAVPILTNGFQQNLIDGMSSTLSNRSIKVFGFKEKTSDVDIGLIINTPRVRKSTSSVSRDESPKSISRTDELENYKLSGKRERAKSLTTTIKGRLAAKPEKKASAISQSLAAQSERKVEVEAKTEAAEDKSLIDKIKAAKGKKFLPKKSSQTAGAVTDSKPQSDRPFVTSSIETKTKGPYVSTSLIDLQQPKKIVGLENIKIAKAPPQAPPQITTSMETPPEITSSMETFTADYRQNYTEGYRNNLIYVLQNNLRIIKSVHEKYDILLSDNNLNIEQITDDSKIFIATELLQIKKYLFDLNTTYELLIELLEQVDENTTIEQSINIKNIFSRIFDEYNIINNIDLYGIEYYFSIPQEIDVQIDTTLQLDTTVQVGGLNRNSIIYFYSWQNNNNFILNIFKKYINLYREPQTIFEENIRTQIAIAENIYKYLSSISLDDLTIIEITRSYREKKTYQNFISTYKFISFFYIIFCNNIKNTIKQNYGIRTDNQEQELLEQIRETETVVAKKVPVVSIEEVKEGEDMSELNDTEIINKEPEISKIKPGADKNKVSQNVILLYYTNEDIIKFLAGPNKTIPTEFKFIIEMGNFSNIIVSSSNRNIRGILPLLFDYIVNYFNKNIHDPRKITNTDIIIRVEVELNGLLFLLYLFYPNILEEQLISYKIGFIEGHRSTRVTDIATKLPAQIPVFINYFEYLFNFIEQILLYTEYNNKIDPIKMYSTDLIFNVTSQLYEKEEEIKASVEKVSSVEIVAEKKQPDKGGKKITSIKNKISKKNNKTKNTKKQTSKKQTRKHKLIKKNKKSKRNNHKTV